MMVFEIKKCGDCKCLDYTGFCMSRHEQRDVCCTACGWAQSFSGDALAVAERIWENLTDYCVEDDGETLDEDYRDPILGWYPAHECERMEVWYDIEEKTGVAVAYLMGAAKNPDGTN